MKYKNTWQKRIKEVCYPFDNITTREHINFLKVWNKLKQTNQISTSSAKNNSLRQFIILKRQIPIYIVNPCIVALSDERSSIRIRYKNIRWEDVEETFAENECEAIIDELYNMLKIEKIYEGLRKDNSILIKYYPLTNN